MTRAEILRARARWRYRGDERPAFAHATGPGEESVWDYPRPPRVEAEARLVRVVAAGDLIAESRRAVRVLETASPPTLYVPESDVRQELLTVARGARSVCEWKGAALAWTLASATGAVAPVAWSYPEPFPEYAVIAGAFAFYPGRVECWLGNERVAPQPGAYYGGWATREIVGPLKGEHGSEDW